MSNESTEERITRLEKTVSILTDCAVSIPFQIKFLADGLADLYGGYFSLIENEILSLRNLLADPQVINSPEQKQLAVQINQLECNLDQAQARQQAFLKKLREINLPSIPPTAPPANDPPVI